jgi:subtilisin-like proprotein convertase family protein
MKKYSSILALSLLVAANARAVLGYSPGVNGIFATIPDGDLTGYQNSLNLSGLQGTIVDVNLNLNITGGFNGDYYVYLTHNSTVSILLNRVGRTAGSAVGYPDGGFGPTTQGARFTLDDQTGTDVHLYRTVPFTLNGGQLAGTWQPDGRFIDPLSTGATFDSTARSNNLGLFNGMNPNGTWTLYLADVSSGGEGTLVSWGMDIVTSAVPEPSFGGLICCAAAAILRRFSRR